MISFRSIKGHVQIILSWLVSCWKTTNYPEKPVVLDGKKLRFQSIEDYKDVFSLIQTVTEL